MQLGCYAALNQTFLNGLLPDKASVLDEISRWVGVQSPEASW